MTTTHTPYLVGTVRPYAVEWGAEGDPNTYGCLVLASSETDAYNAIREMVRQYDFGYKVSDIVPLSAEPDDTEQSVTWMVGPSDTYILSDIPDETYGTDESDFWDMPR